MSYRKSPSGELKSPKAKIESGHYLVVDFDIKPHSLIRPKNEVFIYLLRSKYSLLRIDLHRNFDTHIARIAIP